MTQEEKDLLLLIPDKVQLNNFIKLPLAPPVYSRKLYKLGFVAPTRFGNSYKLANYKANKFFNNK